MRPQGLFVLNICFPHLAVCLGLEVLFPATSIANFLAMFFSTQSAQNLWVALVKVQIPPP